MEWAKSLPWQGWFEPYRVGKSFLHTENMAWWVKVYLVRRRPVMEFAETREDPAARRLVDAPRPLADLLARPTNVHAAQRAKKRFGTLMHVCELLGVDTATALAVVRKAASDTPDF